MHINKSENGLKTGVSLKRSAMMATNRVNGSAEMVFERSKTKKNLFMISIIDFKVNLKKAEERDRIFLHVCVYCLDNFDESRTNSANKREFNVNLVNNWTFFHSLPLRWAQVELLDRYRRPTATITASVIHACMMWWWHTISQKKNLHNEEREGRRMPQK